MELFTTLAQVNVNVVNCALLENIWIMQILSAEKK